MTQTDLAFDLRQRTSAKTGERNIRRWESGQNQPNAALVVAIADALNVSVEDLYDSSEDRNGRGSGDDEDEESALRRVAAHMLLTGHDDIARDLQRLAWAAHERAKRERA